MYILLNLSDWQHTKGLKAWASVSRTLNESKHLLLSLDRVLTGNNLEDDDDALSEQCSHTLGELDTLEPMLDSLHHMVRNKIWEWEAAEDKFDSAAVALAGSSDLMLSHMMQRYYDLPGPERSKETPVIEKVIAEIKKRVETAQKKQGYI
jgi:hypothetical protein